MTPRRQDRAPGWARALAIVALAVFAVPAACSEDSGDATCTGIVTDGVCTAVCQNSGCAADHVCVQNRCSPACASSYECPIGFQCLNVIADDGVTTGGRCAKAPGQYQKCASDAECDAGGGFACIDGECTRGCTTHDECPPGRDCLPPAGGSTQALRCIVPPYAADGSVGQGTPCATSADCDTYRGYTCAESKCTQSECFLHPDCGAKGDCHLVENDDGSSVGECRSSGLPSGPGQFGTTCANGDECDTAAGFECVSVGVGDLEAYCTFVGCKDDADCAGGMYCGYRRIERPACADACGGPLALEDPALPCVPAAEIGAPGTHFTCGAIAMLESICLKRGFCHPCESDFDCASRPNLVCARDNGGTKICTQLCDPNLPSCPMGTAADCGIWDPEVGKPTCAHRFESCSGTGEPCHPCKNDLDCGADGICVGSQLTRERFCLDLTRVCTTDSECPKTVGGLQMICLGEAQQLTPADILYHRCYPPDTDQQTEYDQTGCWPKG
jgi:hypothetical protein